jgi:hypothetical protein
MVALGVIKGIFTGREALRDYIKTPTQLSNARIALESKLLSCNAESELEPDKHRPDSHPSREFSGLNSQLEGIVRKMWE